MPTHHRVALLLLAFPSANAAPSPADATKSVSSLEAWLQEHGSEALTLPDPSGMRLAHWASSGGSVEVLQALASKGADPWDGTATPEERSSLHMACQSGHVPVISYLLSEPGLKLRSRGALTPEKAVNGRDKRDTPCLHLAATAGHVEVIDALASVGAELQAETSKSGTALHITAAVGQLDAAKRLLELGADPCAQNSRGETPRARAEEEEMDELVELLKPLEDAKGCGKKKAKKERKAKKAKKEL